MTGHKYTPEQDAFICNNYANVGDCVMKFNAKFGLNLSYGAIKTHAQKKLRIRSGYRPWTDTMNKRIAELLTKHSYKEATELFNQEHGTLFTVRQMQDHCVRSGMKRGFYEQRKEIDKVIAKHIDKPYKEIAEIVENEFGVTYKTETTICVRANKQGLHREHRRWSVNDKRCINGKQVSYSEFVRFIGNRWHRLPSELHDVAMLAVKLQTFARNK